MLRHLKLKWNLKCCHICRAYQLVIWIILISRNGTAKEFVSLNLVENVKKKNFGNAWKELKLYPTVFRNKLVFSCILTVYFPISNKQYILEQNNSVLNACYLFSCMKISFCLWNWLRAKKAKSAKTAVINYSGL